jgi:hypothetical protein
MNKLDTLVRPVPLTGTVIGFTDHQEKLVVAVLSVECDKPIACEFPQFWNIHHMMAHFVEQPKPLGIGIAATLALSSGKQGWRPADYWIYESPHHLENAYEEFPFYWGPYQMCAHSSLAAIAMLITLRKRWPDLPANETDPKECFRQHMRSPARLTAEERIATLGKWLGVPLPSNLSDGNFQALMSAYATWMGLRGVWPDLFQLTRPASSAWEMTIAENESTSEEYMQPAMSRNTLVFPAGPASFFWPPDDGKSE